MSKVICIKNLNLNYDYALVLKKSHMSNELENVVINSFSSMLDQYRGSGIKTVLITGELFQEDTLLIDVVDRFVDLLTENEEYEFIIGPEKEVTDNSWYNIINWPKNCHLITDEVNYYINNEDKTVFYKNEMNDSLAGNDFNKFEINNKYNENICDFLPKAFTQELKNAIALIDIVKEEVNYYKNEDLLLKEFVVEIDSQMDIKSIVNEVLAQKEDRAKYCYYNCILKGVVMEEQGKDLINKIKEAIGTNMECLYDNKTFRDIDIEEIKRENNDNLIGIFIKNVQEQDYGMEEKRRIIETGLSYLL